MGIGATVAFGGLVFAVSFAALIFSGPDAPEGAIAAGTGLIMFSGLAGACVVAARSTLPAIAEVQDGPSAIFAIMAAAIYATEGIDESEKLPTVEAAIALTSLGTGALMSALGSAKLGNIVRLLPVARVRRIPRGYRLGSHRGCVQGIDRDRVRTRERTGRGG
jgi:MFS superfamily sulfate permease-like transporter